jgi:hypothetical protein
MKFINLLKKQLTLLNTSLRYFRSSARNASMENPKSSSSPTSSSIHSKDSIAPRHDVETPLDHENDTEKEPKDPNIVDWDGPDDVNLLLPLYIHT